MRFVRILGGSAMSFNEDWEEVKLGHLINMQKGFAFKSKDYQNNGIKIVKVSNFTDNSIEINSCTHIAKNKKNNYKKYILKENDILISTVGSWPSNPNSVVGKVIKVFKNAEGSLLNQNIVRLRTKKQKISQIYLYYVLKSNNFKNYVISGARGSANQASITLKSIRKYEFNLPSLNIQNKIVDNLLKIDKKIEINSQINQTLEEIAQAIYKNWFVGFEPFQNKKFVESELGMIPEGWEVKSLEELAKFKNGINYRKGETGNVTFKIVNVKNITRDNFLFIEKLDDIDLKAGKAKRYSIEKWDTVISRSADPGKSMFCLTNKENLIHSGFSIRCRPQDKEKSILIFNLIQGVKKQLNNYSNGTIFKNVNQKILKELKLIVPPDNIIREFNYKILSIYQRIINNNKENQSLKELRDTLLPKLMSGEIRVTSEK